MGKIIKIQGTTFSGDVLRNDQRLTAGSLTLIDWSHGLNPAGVPANNDPVFNIAYKELAALTGLTEDSDLLHHTFLTTYTGSQGKFERTLKGALHGAVSRTDQGGNYGRIASTQATNAAIDWMVDHPTREYAIFLWARVTRSASNDSANLRDVGIGNNTSFAANNLFTARIPNAETVHRVSLSRSAWTGNINSNPASNLFQLAWGNLSPLNSFIPDDGRSYILYGFHIIDVLESGMTYDQLDARDAELFVTAMAEGGRFYGDEWTPPAELLEEE